MSYKSLTYNIKKSEVLWMNLHSNISAYQLLSYFCGSKHMILLK
jgi:hypothetical protein